MKPYKKDIPCKGEMLGCSDVELMPSDDKLLENRILKIQKHTGRIVLGTAAFLVLAGRGRSMLFVPGRVKK